VGRPGRHRRTRFEYRAQQPHIAGEFTDKLQAILDELAAANPGLFEDLRLGALRTDEIARSFGSDPDEVPPPPYDTPRTKPGDVIRLGQHRLMCGDAADAATITAVLGEDAVELLLTDPPYGVSYGAKSRDAAQRNGGTTAHRDIVNDDRTDYADLVPLVALDHPVGALRGVLHLHVEPGDAQPSQRDRRSRLEVARYAPVGQEPAGALAQGLQPGLRADRVRRAPGR
jgi:hypothetical protein